MISESITKVQCQRDGIWGFNQAADVSFAMAACCQIELVRLTQKLYNSLNIVVGYRGNSCLHIERTQVVV